MPRENIGQSSGFECKAETVSQCSTCPATRYYLLSMRAPFHTLSIVIRTRWLRAKAQEEALLAFSRFQFHGPMDGRFWEQSNHIVWPTSRSFAKNLGLVIVKPFPMSTLKTKRRRLGEGHPNSVLEFFDSRHILIMQYALGGAERLAVRKKRAFAQFNFLRLSIALCCVSIEAGWGSISTTVVTLLTVKYRAVSSSWHHASNFGAMPNVHFRYSYPWRPKWKFHLKWALVSFFNDAEDVESGREIFSE